MHAFTCTNNWNSVIHAGRLRESHRPHLQQEEVTRLPHPKEAPGNLEARSKIEKRTNYLWSFRVWLPPRRVATPATGTGPQESPCSRASPVCNAKGPLRVVDLIEAKCAHLHRAPSEAQKQQAESGSRPGSGSPEQTVGTSATK